MGTSPSRSLYCIGHFVASLVEEDEAVLLTAAGVWTQEWGLSSWMGGCVEGGFWCRGRSVGTCGAGTCGVERGAGTCGAGEGFMQGLV